MEAVQVLDNAPLCDVEIDRNERGEWSIKLDGKEMAQYITGFTFKVGDAGEIPIMNVSIAVDGFNLSSKAIFEIPRPYSVFWPDNEKEMVAFQTVKRNQQKSSGQ